MASCGGIDLQGSAHRGGSDSSRDGGSATNWCIGQAPMLLASARLAVGEVVVDATDVYWVDQADGLPTRVIRTPKAGGASTVVDAVGWPFQVDDQNIYY